MIRHNKTNVFVKQIVLTALLLWSATTLAHSLSIRVRSQHNETSVEATASPLPPILSSQHLQAAASTTAATIPKATIPTITTPDATPTAVTTNDQGPRYSHASSSLFSAQRPHAATNVPKPVDHTSFPISIVPSTASSSRNYGKVILLSNGVEFRLYAVDTNSSHISETPITLKLDKLADRHRHWITSVDYTFDESQQACKSSNYDNGSNNNNNISIEGNKAKCLVIFWLDGYLNEIRTAALHLEVDSASHVVDSALDWDSSINPTIGTTARSPHITLRYFGKIANSSQRFKHHDHHNTRTISDFLIDHDSKTLFFSIKQDNESFIIASHIFDASVEHQKFDISHGSADKLSVDTREGVLFYLDNSGAINRINLFNQTTTIVARNVRAKCLTISKSEKRVYWLTADGYVYSINYHGREKRVVMHLNTRRAEFEPYAMRIADGMLYFSDMSKHSLIKAPMLDSPFSSPFYNSDFIVQDDVLTVESPAMYGFQFIESLTLPLKLAITSRDTPIESRFNLAADIANLSPTTKSETNLPVATRGNRRRMNPSTDISKVNQQVVSDPLAESYLHPDEYITRTSPFDYMGLEEPSRWWHLIIIIGVVTAVFLLLLLILLYLRNCTRCLDDGGSPLINEYQPSFAATTSKVSSDA